MHITWALATVELYELNTWGSFCDILNFCEYCSNLKSKQWWQISESEHSQAIRIANSGECGSMSSFFQMTFL